MQLLPEKIFPSSEKVMGEGIDNETYNLKQTLFCLRPKLDHLAQTCHGRLASLSSFQRFDAAVPAAVEAAAQEQLGDVDGLTEGRLALPARRFGCGLWRLAATDQAAFVGAVCCVALMLVGSIVGGEISNGSVNQ